MWPPYSNTFWGWLSSSLVPKTRGFDVAYMCALTWKWKHIHYSNQLQWLINYRWYSFYTSDYYIYSHKLFSCVIEILTSREASEAGLATAVVVVDVKNEILLWCGYRPVVGHYKRPFFTCANSIKTRENQTSQLTHSSYRVMYISDGRLYKNVL